MTKTAAKTDTIIPPTIGRVVWYRTAKPSADGPVSQPFAALVAYVHDDRLVTLAVFDHNGCPERHANVTLLQEGDEPPAEGCYAEWMPYQLGQAKKNA